MSKILTLKKKIILILSVLAVGFFMTAGFAFIARADGLTVTSEQFKMKGASVRYVDDTHGPGVKFHVLLNKGVFDGLSDTAKTGLKLCPEKLLGGETLASSTNANIVDIETRKSDWKASDTDENMMELTVYVYDIPAANYGTDIKVAGYVTDGGKTVYTEAVNDTYSLAYVAKAAAGVVQDADKISQLEGYYKFKFKAYDLNGALVGGEQTAIYGETLTQPTSTSTLTCGWFNKAKTKKWEFSSDVVSGNVSLYETKHNFNDNGVCDYCGTNIKSQWLSASGNNSIVTYMDGKGWEVKSTDGDNWYCTISGDTMKHYIDSGCTEMKITYVNQFAGVANTDEGNFVNTRSRIIPLYADSSKGEDWKYQNAHEKFVSSLPSGSSGYYTMTVDLTDSNYDFTKDTRICFVNHDVKNKAVTRGYISDIEFINYKDKSQWLSASGNNSIVTYMDGKGWEVKSTDGNIWYSTISGDTMKHYIDSGCTEMKITYVNQFEGVVKTDEGNFINTKTRLLPYKVGSGEEWTYQNIYISGHPRNSDGSYTSTIDLTDSAYDFTRDTRICFVNHDVKNKAVTCGYIKNIEFINYEAPEARLVGGHNGTVEYIKGKGWHAYANSNEGYYYEVPADVLSYYINKGYTSLKISFTNSFNLAGVVTAGASVNCQAAFLPKKAADGTEDNGYKAGFISQLTRDEANDSYYWVFDLTNTTYDFTKGMRIYNTYSDVGGAAVGHTYINAIEFSKSELPNA